MISKADGFGTDIEDCELGFEQNVTKDLKSLVAVTLHSTDTNCAKLAKFILIDETRIVRTGLRGATTSDTTAA